MKLPAHDGQHIHSRHRLLLQQNRNIIAADLETDRLFHRKRGGLVRRIFKHRGKAEEIAMTWLIHQHLLMVLVHRRHPYRTRHHHVSMFARFADLVDALTRSKSFDLDLRRQNGHLIVVEQSKEWNLSQVFRLASHRSPQFCL